MFIEVFMDGRLSDSVRNVLGLMVMVWFGLQVKFVETAGENVAVGVCFTRPAWLPVLRKVVESAEAKSIAAGNNHTTAYNAQP